MQKPLARSVRSAVELSRHGATALVVALVVAAMAAGGVINVWLIRLFLVLAVLVSGVNILLGGRSNRRLRWAGFALLTLFLVVADRWFEANVPPAPPNAREIATEVVRQLPAPASPSPPVPTADEQRVRARLTELLSKADSAQDHWYYAFQTDRSKLTAAIKEVEDWRTEFGEYADIEPHLKKCGVGRLVLSKGGDRISEPVIRLRTVLENLHRCFE